MSTLEARRLARCERSMTRQTVYGCPRCYHRWDLRRVASLHITLLLCNRMRERNLPARVHDLYLPALEASLSPVLLLLFDCRENFLVAEESSDCLHKDIHGYHVRARSVSPFLSRWSHTRRELETKLRWLFSPTFCSSIGDFHRGCQVRSLIALLVRSLSHLKHFHGRYYTGERVDCRSPKCKTSSAHAHPPTMTCRCEAVGYQL